LSAVLLLGWVAIGVTSIGLFYMPSAVMMVRSALRKSAWSDLGVSDWVHSVPQHSLLLLTHVNHRNGTTEPHVSTVQL
jgi:hypothetical protein